MNLNAVWIVPFPSMPVAFFVIRLRRGRMTKKVEIFWNHYPGLAALTLGYHMSPLRGFDSGERFQSFQDWGRVCARFFPFFSGDAFVAGTMAATICRPYRAQGNLRSTPGPSARAIT